MRKLETSVRDLISRYVAGSITVDQLSDALPDGWDLDEADEPATAALVMLVVGYIAEYQLNRRSETQLREDLKREASWRVGHKLEAINRPITTPHLATQAHAGAGTRLQVVLAS